MNELPPRAKLLQVLRSLSAQLPGQMVGLLEAPRFAEGVEALRRLADPAYAQAAVDAMTPDEVAWMTARLLARWERLAPVSLDPSAAVTVPEEIWLGDRPVRVPVTLAVFGIDDDWEAAWEGAVVPGLPGKTATLLAQPPEGSEPAQAVVRARVRARAGGKRLTLIAEGRVWLRRPAVILSDDGLRLLVRDHAGQPAPGARVELGDARFTAGPGGLIELPSPPAPDTPLRVEGISAGRLRGRAR